MELKLEGGVERPWTGRSLLLGKREVHLRASGILPERIQDENLPRELFRELYRLFCRQVTPYLVANPEEPYDTSEGLDLIAVMSNLSRKPAGEAEPIHLLNLRGQPAERSSIEKLMEVQGVIQIENPEIDLADAPEKDKQERFVDVDFRISVFSHFHSFRGRGGIEYALTYGQVLPDLPKGKLDAGFLNREDIVWKVTKFFFAKETFASSSFGMSLGLVPSVQSRAHWKFSEKEISLFLSKELSRTESPRSIGNLPELKDFDRALAVTDIYSGLLQRCTDYLEAAPGG